MCKTGAQWGPRRLAQYAVLFTAFHWDGIALVLIFRSPDHPITRDLPIYFSLAPTGTSSRKLTSTGLPSSPTDAATIMPLDSSPRSLRGWRLATITTLRPISVSGAYAVAIPA